MSLYTILKSNIKNGTEVSERQVHNYFQEFTKMFFKNMGYNESAIHQEQIDNEVTSVLGDYTSGVIAWFTNMNSASGISWFDFYNQVSAGSNVSQIYVSSIEKWGKLATTADVTVLYQQMLRAMFYIEHIFVLYKRGIDKNLIAIQNLFNYSYFNFFADNGEFYLKIGNQCYIDTKYGVLKLLLSAYTYSRLVEKSDFTEFMQGIEQWGNQTHLDIQYDCKALLISKLTEATGISNQYFER